VDFSTGKPQPPRTTPVGQETRNWLWKRGNLAKKSLALIPIVRTREFEQGRSAKNRSGFDSKIARAGRIPGKEGSSLHQEGFTTTSPIQVPASEVGEELLLL
jgi:hypothetical protein